MITYNKKTNGLRHKINTIKFILSKGKKLLKDSTKYIKRSYGRSLQQGKITSWHKSRGHKKLFRILQKHNNLYRAITVAILYDPLRTNYISLNFNLLSKTFFQLPAIKRVYPGTLVQSTTKNKINRFKIRLERLLSRFEV